MRLLIAFYIVQAMMLLSLLVLAIMTYRAKRTVGFLLLMLASICYFLQWFAPYMIALLTKVVGPKPSVALTAWVHSWWFAVSHTFAFLFLGLTIASLAFFVRESARSSDQVPN
jgi:hypothetical protein